MNILVIDSCGSSCGVCVWQDGRVLAQAQEQMERGQDTRLMPMIMATLANAKIEFSDLDKIAVTKGPGSFTGVRVGLATARGIGIASGKPVIGIDRFSIYHAMQTEQHDLLIVIQSKRTELFCRYLPANGAAHDPCMMTQEEIDDFLLQHPATKIAGDTDPCEGNVLKTAAKLACNAQTDNMSFAASPLYLRAPDVTLPKANGARTASNPA